MMFGFSQRSRIREIDIAFTQIMTLLGSGGDERAVQGIQGVKSAHKFTQDLEGKGRRADRICDLVREKCRKDNQSTSGYNLGVQLVIYKYMVKGISGTDARELENTICTVIDNVTKESEKNRWYSNDENADVSIDTKMRIAMGSTSALAYMVNKLDVFAKRQGALLKPQVLGYLWGWCDATTQLSRCDPNSSEVISVHIASFWHFFKSITDEISEEQIAEIFKIAEAGIIRCDPIFTRHRARGGQDCLDFATLGTVPEGIVDAAFTFG